MPTITEYNGQMVESREVECPHCGHWWESDNPDTPPSGIELCDECFMNDSDPF